jgi:Fur family peroxide stress response transcriptional regulator
MNNQNITQAVESLKLKLRDSSIKLTPQRLEIFKEIMNAEDHPNAEIIYKRVREKVPTVSLDTVYRTLWLYNELGLITALGYHRDKIRFDANLESHHHFTCRECGAIHDFYSEELNQISIPETVRAYGNVEKAHVEVRGLCRACVLRKEMGAF